MTIELRLLFGDSVGIAKPVMRKQNPKMGTFLKDTLSLFNAFFFIDVIFRRAYTILLTTIAQGSEDDFRSGCRNVGHQQQF